MGLFGKSKKNKEADVAFSHDTDSILDEEFGPETTVSVNHADGANDTDAAYKGLVSNGDPTPEQVYKNENPVPEIDVDSDPVLSDKFMCIGSVDDERNNDICNRFVMGGIEQFADGVFEERFLDELSYDELCHIYNTVAWFVSNAAPYLVNEARNYKRYLKIKIVERLCRINTYTIVSDVTALPFSVDKALLLFTDEALAERICRGLGKDNLRTCLITPDNFAWFFGKYYCAGFESVKVNVKNAVPLSDVCPAVGVTDYGLICRDGCAAMIEYKQALADAEFDARTEERPFTAEERTELGRLSLAASEILLNRSLLLPAQTRDGQAGDFVIPVITLEDGRKFVAAFTDADALSSYYNKPVASIAMPELIRSLYRDTFDSEIVKGIIVNPGREAYVLTKNMLGKLIGN